MPTRAEQNPCCYLEKVGGIPQQKRHSILRFSIAERAPERIHKWREALAEHRVPNEPESGHQGAVAGHRLGADTLRTGLLRFGFAFRNPLSITRGATSEEGFPSLPPMDESSPKRPSWKTVAGLVVGLLLPIGLWFAPLGMEPKAQQALAISVFMVVFWATELTDFALTGLIGCYLYWMLGTVPFSKAFGGFAEDSPWFLLGAILFGAMATKTGLARRMGYLVLSRVGASPRGSHMRLPSCRVEGGKG